MFVMTQYHFQPDNSLTENVVLDAKERRKMLLQRVRQQRAKVLEQMKKKPKKINE